MNKEEIPFGKIDDNNNNILHIACKEGQYGAAKLLAENHPELIGKINSDGHTPLALLQLNHTYYQHYKSQISDLDALSKKFEIIQCLQKIALQSGVYSNATRVLLEEMLFNSYKESPLKYKDSIDVPILGDEEQDIPYSSDE